MTNPTEGNKGREIKFRVWNPNTSQLWSGPTRSNWEYLKEAADIDGAVVEQFTGLLDKSGKEIYEGDIVEAAFPHDGAYEIRIAPIGGVELWRGGSPLGAYNDASDPLNLDWRNLKVIGNIYENEDLLK